ncbi:ATP-dependent RNA helicase DDX51 [Amphibalanus amphitrite]|uniref:ATP-dependent RNA helicase DDX51 n=1 Tax=Amphibalanus amphitrite TaxID=1232801 RepID=A0A6A4VWX4_AMPAM|nr:ATP-dependent RNA helicase DDX51 [Amphibalanus amphitrite]
MGLGVVRVIVANDDDSEDASESDEDAAADDFTALDEVERLGRRAVHRVVPDWLAHPQPISDWPASAELPALYPGLRAWLVAEGIERLFAVRAAVLPELLAADLGVSAPTGRGKTLAFVLPLVQAPWCAGCARWPCCPHRRWPLR